MTTRFRYRRSFLSSVRLFRRSWRSGRDLVFPPRCAYCDVDLPASTGPLRLCAVCHGKLVPEDWPCCGRCGAVGPLPVGGGPGCELCRGESLRFQTTVPLGGYAGELRAAVLRMKRPAGEGLSMVMGEALGQFRREQILQFSPDVVVPVPMYWARRIRRGTNSPEVLAESAARVLKVPLCLGVLDRRRNTLPQKDLKPRERFRNVRGAFRAKRGYNFFGVRVLLVDDILTTGATCSEAARTLLDAGAEAVAVAVLARAQGPFAA